MSDPPFKVGTVRSEATKAGIQKRQAESRFGLVSAFRFPRNVRRKRPPLRGPFAVRVTPASGRWIRALNRCLSVLRPDFCPRRTRKIAVFSQMFCVNQV
jgi:hypothetical protein